MTEQLIAIFGIGALTAIQAIFFRPAIANLLAWFQIRTKKPFQQGDFIRCGEFEGVVQNISFSGTTLKRSDGATVAIANSTLTSTPVINKSSSNRRPIATEILLSPTIHISRLRYLLRKLPEKIQGREVPTKGFGNSSIWQDVQVKIQSITEAGVKIKVSGFHHPYYGELWVKHKNLFMQWVLMCLDPEDYPPADLNVHLANASLKKKTASESDG